MIPKNDIAALREERRRKCECAQDIEEAIRKNCDGWHLNKECTIEVVEKHGLELVLLVLANTVQLKDYDGRFSRSNKEWAKSYEISDLDPHQWIVGSHPAVLDGFIDLARKSPQIVTMFLGSNYDLFEDRWHWHWHLEQKYLDWEAYYVELPQGFYLAESNAGDMLYFKKGCDSGYELFIDDDAEDGKPVLVGGTPAESLTLKVLGPAE